MHADAIQMSTLVGSSINRGGAVGVLTNTVVANGDTVAGIQSGILAVTGLHADVQGFKSRVANSLGADAGITNSTVASLTTVAGLAALTVIGSKPNLDLYGE